MPQLACLPLDAETKVSIHLFHGDLPRLDRWCSRVGSTRAGAVRALLRDALDRIEAAEG